MHDSQQYSAAFLSCNTLVTDFLQEVLQPHLILTISHHVIKLETSKVIRICEGAYSNIGIYILAQTVVKLW